MDTRKKIVNLKTLTQNIARWRRTGKRIAFTNGCFDIIHYGHVYYLQKAKRAERILIVGLNSDRSVRKIKGALRPLVPQAQRAAVLAAFACVDYVTIFHERTPLKLIERLRPDILIKGADWKNKGVVGSDVVKRYGGRVEHIRYLKNFSSTKMIEKIIQKCAQ